MSDDRDAPAPLPPAAPPAVPGEVWLDGLRATARGPTAWLWHGYLAAGNVTLLVSRWKAGKTTLASVLLAKLKAGGELAGRPVAAGKAAVVTEEDPSHWLRRSERLDFAGHVCWLCRPFRAKPTGAEWLALLDRLDELRARHGLTLAVIDPLAVFLPGRDESNAALMLEALAPLQRLTAAGMAVLLLHHPRKAAGGDGLAFRGSGALPGNADVYVEMAHPGRAAEDDRRRLLKAFSRFDETPRRLVIELTADGTDYRVAADAEQAEFARGWGVVRALLQGAPAPWARRDLLARWPRDQRRPTGPTLWRWLDHAAAQGLVCRCGKGRKHDPFLYWLPDREAELRQDPFVEAQLEWHETARALEEEVRERRWQRRHPE